MDKIKAKLFSCKHCKSDMAVKTEEDKIDCLMCGKPIKLLLKDRSNT